METINFKAGVLVADLFRDYLKQVCFINPDISFIETRASWVQRNFLIKGPKDKILNLYKILEVMITQLNNR
jgi:hypothetical protein